MLTLANATAVTSLLLAGITLVFAFGGALFGMYVVRDRFHPEAKSFLTIALGLITSMVALLLSLQLSSAKTFFDGQELQVAQIGSEAMLLDRALRQAGVGASVARKTLRQTIADMLQPSQPNQNLTAGISARSAGEVLYSQIQGISPSNQAEAASKDTALGLVVRLAETVRLNSEVRASSMALPLLAFEISWITLIFIAYGLLAPANRSAVVAVACCAAALAGSIFLIAEMSSPYSGFLRASTAALSAALAQIDSNP